MIALAGISVALASGGGLFVGANAGGGWTDRLGPIQRGSAGDLAIGAYFGHFRGTYRFGDYWRVGASVQWNPLYLRTTTIDDRGRYVRTKEFVESLYMPGLQIGRGADLVNIGCWWTVSAGPVIVSNAQFPYRDPDGVLSIGAGVTGTAAAAYSPSRWIALSFRLSAGLQRIDQVTSASGGFGLGVLLRAPLLRLDAGEGG